MFFNAMKDGKTIQTTRKMFETVYKEQGYIICEPEPEQETPKEKSLCEMTLTELKQLAKQKGHKIPAKITAAELLTLLEPTTENEELEQENADESGNLQENNTNENENSEAEGGGENGTTGLAATD